MRTAHVSLSRFPAQRHGVDRPERSSSRLAMTAKGYALLAAVVFTVVGVLQLARAFEGWAVVVVASVKMV